MSANTIVSLHAHPDDEALLTAGWLAQRAAAGDRVVLVFATDGAAGLAGANHREDLARVRRAEAAASAAAIGAARVVWLGHRDSGSVDSESVDSGCFAATDVARVAARVAAVLDDERATHLTGYDANGGYGHPDHRQVHRVARAAQSLAHSRPVLWEATWDRTWLARLFTCLRPLEALLRGITIPGTAVFSARDSIDRIVDVTDQMPAKRAALAAHASQTGGGIRTLSVLLALPGPIARRLLGTEYFVEVP